MKVACAYYSNNRRLGLVLGKLNSDNNIAVFPVVGVVVRSTDNAKCFGDRVEVLVYTYSRSVPVLLTNAVEYADYNGQVFDYVPQVSENIYVQALRLCAAKVATSSNAFSMECVLRGCTVVASTHGEDKVTYTLKTPSGEILTESDIVPSQLYTQCQSIRSFQHSIITDSCEKDIVVRKGQVEVFREIAHYINKALVFTTVSEAGDPYETCITSTGCCEVRRMKNGGLKVCKVPFTRMKIDTNAALTALDCSLDVLLRSPNFSYALRGAGPYDYD